MGMLTDGAAVVLLPPDREEDVRRRTKKKRAARIAAAVIVPIVILTVFFAVMLNVRALGVGEGSTGGAYGKVLADIDGITRANPRIIDIAMLGAHDANSFSVDADAPIDHKTGGDLLKAVYPVSSGFQYRMSVTQTVSPYALLMQGARMLHMKYTYYDGMWYATHSLLGRPFEEDVLDVLRYLAQHPGEVVILFLQCTYFGETQSLDTFHDWLADVRLDGKNIYDYVNYGEVNVYGSEFDDGVRIEQLTYNDVTRSGASAGVVLMDRREYPAVIEGDTEESAYSAYFFDIDSNSSQEWHNRMGSGVLVGEIDRYALELNASGLYRWKLRVNQTQAAVSGESFGDVMRSIGAWSLLKFAEKHNAALLENDNFDAWLKAMPVFQVDFANSSYGDFNRRVNEKIRARNEYIVSVLSEEGSTYEDLYR